MNSRLRKVLIEKFELSDENPLEDLPQLFLKELTNLDEKQKHVLMEKLKGFLLAASDTMDDYEKQVSDNAAVIETGEHRLSDANERARAEAELLKKVLDRLRTVLENVNIDRFAGEQSENYGEQLIDMIEQVDALVKAHESSLRDMDRLMTVSLDISKSKNMVELNDRVGSGIETLLGCKASTKLYMQDLQSRHFWETARGQKLIVAEIVERHTETLFLRDEQDRVLFIFGIDIDAKDQGQIHHRQIENLKTLSPVILATRDIIRFLEQQSDKLRIQHELETAKVVQQRILPSPIIDTQKLRIYGHYESASECGGDWWSCYSLPGRDIVILGDVTGHGTASALVTTFSKGFFDASLVSKDVELEAVLENLNEKLFHFGNAGMTVICADFNYNTGSVR
ncbi:MAG: SpoIIE family protein phosphatase, partial [Pseudomonadota bacterium]